MESRHFFRDRDTVLHRDGGVGTVVSGQALFAIVEWGDGRRQEIDQFDPSVEVIERDQGR